MTTAYEPVSIPHLQVPLVLGADGDFEYVQQDTEQEIEQSVAVLLGTMTGQRPVVPAYGISDPTFVNPNASEIEQAVNTWEPRAQVAVTIVPDGQGNSNVSVQVAPAAPSS